MASCCWRHHFPLRDGMTTPFVSGPVYFADHGALKNVFHVTNVQDGDLAELNQRGVNSQRFVPGPNSPAREPFVKVALENSLASMGHAA